jgi:hypothetical protein
MPPLHRSATGSSVPVPSTATTKIISHPFHPPCYSVPVYPTTPTTVHHAPGPTHAPPRMSPLQAPSQSVSPRLASSPRVGPSRAPSPRVRPSHAPSPRVIPRQVPSPGVIPTLAPPAMPPTLNHLQHQPPSPTAHTPPPRESYQHGNGIPGTNLYVDFEDVIEEEHAPPQHRTRSQTARHIAHSVHSIPVANAVIHPTTGANMEYRGLISDEEIFPI